MNVPYNREQQFFLVTGGIILVLILVVVIFDLIRSPESNREEVAIVPTPVVKLTDSENESARGKPWITSGSTAPVFSNSSSNSNDEIKINVPPRDTGSLSLTADTTMLQKPSAPPTPVTPLSILPKPGPVMGEPPPMDVENEGNQDLEPISTEDLVNQDLHSGSKANLSGGQGTKLPTPHVKEKSQKGKIAEPLNAVAASTPAPSEDGKHVAVAPPPVRSKSAPHTGTPVPSPAAKTAVTAESSKAGSSPVSSSAGGKFVIQIASFTAEANALAVQKQVSNLKIASYHSNVSVNGRPYYRVFAGPFATRSESEQALKLLQSQSALTGKILQTAN
ncbi:MAG: SPOR domain-containing protein [Magnetococcus sp. DMHC-6]